MGLNIKNERVCRLAREAAARTGQTQTGAIESALENYLAGLLARADADERQRADAFNALLARMRADWPRDGRTGHELLEDLYDPSTGLPR